MIEFRDLRADEVELREARVTEKGVQLLVYKDARCDMAILDEAVGAENWQREHYELKGNIYCRVGINAKVWEKNPESDRWVWKSDCGAETNTEAEKGEASDSFKRACVNWGIGRELYTKIFIWIMEKDCELKKNEKGKLICASKFFVSALEVKNKKITRLEVTRQRSKNLPEAVVFSWWAEPQAPSEPQKQEEPQKLNTHVSEYTCISCGGPITSTLCKDGSTLSPAETSRRCGGMCATCFKKSFREKNRPA